MPDNTAPATPGPGVTSGERTDTRRWSAEERAKHRTPIDEDSADVSLATQDAHLEKRRAAEAEAARKLQEQQKS